ncbi:10745_t:CDS:2 [Cetraspora pellucida]|uniref:10745_t:CDS:1 n=1 Tax=Cetraspora pellucida TaxID=1433469 RepID=A0A9N9B786_9GLOM|nr:10745_t:CDS:2 [Cetraspora pellucida]
MFLRTSKRLNDLRVCGKIDTLLVNILDKCVTLRSLKFSDNEFSPIEVKALTKILYKNNGLTSLDIITNQLGKLLAEALYKNVTIISLELFGNEIDNITLDTINNLLVKNKENN